MTTDLVALDAVATAQLVRSGQASPVEVVQAALTRLQQRNPAINAVIDVWADEALAQARAGVPQGLLAGVPMLLKDTIDHPGHRYAMGSRLRLGTSGRHLDPWVAAMRAEGAIFIGKTNTPEFGLMDVTEPLAFGPTRNPWRHSLASGGSSESQKNCRMNAIGLQFTDASMLRPMISIAITPHTSDRKPVVPR